MAIKRYARPEMEKGWSDERKFRTWLDVELAVLEAKEELGLIPKGIASKTKRTAKFTVAEIEKREEEIGHDLLAFVQVVSESLLPEVRPYFHAGLTSYDIEDTGLATQLRDFTDLIETELSQLSQNLKEVARRY